MFQVPSLCDSEWVSNAQLTATMWGLWGAATCLLAWPLLSQEPDGEASEPQGPPSTGTGALENM